MRPALVLTVLAMGAMVFGGRREEISTALSMPESKRYLLFYLVMILGIPFAYHRGVAFGGVFQGYLINVLFFVLLVSQVTSLQKLKRLVLVICLSTLTYGFFGGLLLGASGGRIGVFGNAFDPNDTAFVLLSLFPLCLYFVRFNEGLLIRVVAIVAICSAIAVVLLTGSRGGLLGLGTVLLILLLTKTGGVKKSHKILLLVMLATTFLLMEDKIDVERYLTLSDVSSDYNATGEGGRIDLWNKAIALTIDHPITGVGVECYAYAQYLLRERAGASYLGWLQPHNSILQIAAEVGLVGFSIFALIIVRSFLTFLRAGRNKLRSPSQEANEFSALAGLMLLGFAGLLVSGFFITQGYSFFFTLYFALAAAMGRIQDGLSVDIVSQSSMVEWEKGPRTSESARSLR